ncbi:MAG: DUF6259 domain-containing protein [Limnochordia bacterium]|nr:DUF6259 domain-containing protein [Limnochordia bacterium]
MRNAFVAVIVILMCTGFACAQSYRDSLEDASVWRLVPEAVSNAAFQSNVTVQEAGLCFSVISRNRGMKWQQEIPKTVDADAYFLLRYRAENFNTSTDEFVLSVNQGSRAEEHLVMAKDIISDGEWHLLAIEMHGIQARIIEGIWVQVQATRLGNASLCIDDIAFSNELPQGAQVVKAPGTKDDYHREVESERALSMAEESQVLPIDKTLWVARPSWLGNPTDNPILEEVPAPPTYSKEAKAWRFAVSEVGKGMKWTCTLDNDQLIDVTDTPYLVVRYRAGNTATRTGQPHSDFFIFIYDVDEREYIPLNLYQLQDDGRWNTAVAVLPSITIKTIIVQVQAGQPDAFAEIGSLGFYSGNCKLQPREDESPVTVASIMDGKRRLSDDLDYAYDWHDVNLDEFDPVPLVGAQVDVALPFQRDEFDAKWFREERITVITQDEAVPFLVNPEAPQLIGTTLSGTESVGVEIGKEARSLYLLMGARFVGDEDPSLGSGAITSISQVERFLLEIQYEDGTKEQIFPQRLDNGTHQIERGFGVYVVVPSKVSVISRLVLRDEMRNGSFYLGGLTIGRKEWAHGSGYPKAVAPVDTPKYSVKNPGEGRIYEAEGRIVFENEVMQLIMTATNQPRLISLRNRYSDTEMLQAPSPIFEYMGGLNASDFSLVDVAVTDHVVTFTLAAEKTKLELTGQFDSTGEVVFGLRVINQSEKTIAPQIRFPAIRNVAFARAERHDLGQLWYVYPRRGVYISDRLFDAGVLYSGYFPLQFLSFFSPELGGFYVITRDLELTHKIFELTKTGEQTGSLGVYYDNKATNTIAPGGSLVLPDASLGVYERSWHGSFFAYKNWVDTWYQPVAPRKDWFQQVFNFRQQFMHFGHPKKSGMFDEKQKVFNFQPAIDEDIEAFGSIDYLHLFDWAWTPTHGRVGDYNPWEYLGSAAAFKEAIDGVHEQGIPVGLYLEGYLVSPESLVGKAHGADWQLLNRDLRPYPQWSPNYDLCPHCEPWQDYLSSTYRSIWEVTGARGFYLDQLGFGGYEKFCYSSEHGHELGIPPIRGEAALLNKVRAVLPTEVVLYTEEAPVDVITQYQDGAFSYAVGLNQPDWSPHGLNLYRFAFPDFKTIEIITVDRPIGSNYQSLKQVFFNAEGVWLMGTPSEWYTPETLGFIRKMNQVLTDYADVFTSPSPFPLYPTLIEVS